VTIKKEKIDPQKILDRIASEAERFREENGSCPKILKLPYMVAFDLARGTCEQVGFIANKTSLGGIKLLEGEYLYGMMIQIIRNNTAEIDFE
jgi:hypothetical protein